jgi:hypothetical protein
MSRGTTRLTPRRLSALLILSAFPSGCGGRASEGPVDAGPRDAVGIPSPSLDAEITLQSDAADQAQQDATLPIFVDNLRLFPAATTADAGKSDG